MYNTKILLEQQIKNSECEKSARAWGCTLNK